MKTNSLKSKRIFQEKCTACEKGFVFVARIVLRGGQEELKALRLCRKCKDILITSIGKGKIK